jgi:cytochrome c
MFGFSARLICASVFAGVLIGSFAANAQMPPQRSRDDAPQYGFGTTPSTAELSRFFAIRPDGRGLPVGSGTYAQGQAVYAQQCASCHGAKLGGWGNGMLMPPELAAMGDGRLIGGRGSLRTSNPVFTVESFWPYATTLWDYIKRAMPQSAPGSLSDNDAYAVVAFLLGEANIISKSTVVSERTLPTIMMPNREGVIDGGRPEPNPNHPVPASASPPSGQSPPAKMPGNIP